MFDKMGVHWGVALPGFLSLVCIPATWVFYKYGAGIRAKCKYSADAERQMAMIMAARMAQSKQEDEEARAEGKEIIYPVGSRPEGEMQDVQPAEQEGGLGKVVSRAGEYTGPQSNAGAPLARVPTHLHHEWTIYEALADRDENDLEDDERIKLQDLHNKFDNKLRK